MHIKDTINHVMAVASVSPTTMRAVTTHIIALLITLAGLYDMLVFQATSGPLIDLTYAVVVAYIGIHGVAVGARSTQIARDMEIEQKEQP